MNAVPTESTAAPASREANCPRCGKTWKLRKDTGRLPQHGPPGNRCKGSLKSPAEVLAELEEET